MASQFSTNALTAYSNEQSKELFTKMFMGFETLDSGSIKVIDTVKETIKLKYLDSTVTLQAGDCGFNASGAVTLSDKTFGVNSLKHDTELCENDLDGFSFEIFNNPGTNNGMQMELLNSITENISVTLNSTMENEFWNAVTGSTHIYGGGIFTQVALDGNATAQTFNWGHSSQTYETIVAQVEAMFNALPSEAQKDAVLYVGYDVYNKIAQAYLHAFNYNIGFDPNGMLPGTTMKIAKSTKISNKALATTTNNLVYLTDVKEEVKGSRIWFSQDDLITKVHIPFKAGAGYFYGQYIIYTKAA